jgi:hypothetical protein
MIMPILAMDTGIFSIKSDRRTYAVPKEVAGISPALQKEIEQGKSELDMSAVESRILKKQIRLMHDVYQARKKSKSSYDIVQALRTNDIPSDQLKNHVFLADKLGIPELVLAFKHVGKRKRNELSIGYEMKVSDMTSFCVSLDNGHVTFKRAEIGCDEELFDYAGSTFVNAVRDCSSECRLKVINQIFYNLDTVQTVLLIEALEAFRNDQEEQQDKHLALYTSMLDKNELVFLLNQANYLDIPSLQRRCTELLIKNRSLTFNEVDQLPPELATPIIRERFKYLDEKIAKRGGLIKFQIPMFMHMVVKKVKGAAHKFLVQDEYKSIYLYNAEDNTYKELAFPSYRDRSNDYEISYVTALPEGNYLFFLKRMWGQGPILFYDAQTEIYRRVDPLNGRYGSFFSGLDHTSLVFNNKKTQFLFLTDFDSRNGGRNISVMDIQTGKFNIIDRILGDEYLYEYAFNLSGDRIVVNSSKGLRLYDVHNAKPIAFIDDLEWICFNDVENRLFFLHSSTLYTCDIVTGICTSVFYIGQDHVVKTVLHKKNENKLFFETDLGVLMYDERTQTAMELFRFEENEALNKDYKCDYTQIDMQYNILMVRTNKRSLFFNAMNGESLNSLYYLKPWPFSSSILVGNNALIKDDGKQFIYSIDNASMEPFDDNDSFSLSVGAEIDSACRMKNGFVLNQDESIKTEYLIQSEGSLVILTNERLINYGFSNEKFWEQLSYDQLDLIQEASQSWEIDTPYEIKKEQNDIYNNLPDALKNTRFFIVK